MEEDELVYACTAHNKYACRDCVPRAARLAVDEMLDECVVVEQELVQFSQELGLGLVDVLAAARGWGGLGADKGVPRVVRREGAHEQVGILPVSAPELEEAGGDVAAGGDGLTMGDTTVTRLGWNGM